MSISFSFLLVFVIVILMIFVIVIGNSKIKTFNYVKKDLPRFSVDVHFDPYPRTIAIENEFDCNAHSLKTCDINDSSTLFGCKELIVRCHHFDKDTEFIENNVAITIPKNKTPTEGYALAITTIADACNPYHGDLTLVTANSESTEYMLICTCKNPGYIGNENILGNCTSTFICDGKIDGIDKPLNEINCVCNKNQKSIRYDDGLPVCKDLLVHEANELYSDWTNLVDWNSERQISTDNYNPTVKGNVNTTRLLDPCRNSILDTSQEIPNAQLNQINNECDLFNYGFPISNGLLSSKNPVKNIVPITAVVSTKQYEKLRFTDYVGGKRRLLGIEVKGLSVPGLENELIVVAPQNGMAINQSVNMESTNEFIAPACSGSWPSYSCKLEYKNNYKINHLSLPKGRSCPGTFLWGRETWTDNEYLLNSALESYGSYGVKTKKLVDIIDKVQPYGLQWSINKGETGIVLFNNFEDYKKHKNVLTQPEI